MMQHGAVLRAAGEVDRFPVVLVEVGGLAEQHLFIACVYSSKTGVWGNLTSTSVQSKGTFTLYFKGMPSVLVGNSLYWLFDGDFVGIVEFNLERHSLAVIEVPLDMFESFDGFTLMRAEDGELSLLSLSGFTAQLWKRNTITDGVPSWGIVRTVELDKLLSLDSEGYVTTHGFAEDNNLVILRVNINIISTVQIESLQFKKVSDNSKWYYYPFESVYAAGI
ncbi:unnamed protein product [Triticum turgidum subsp. durum]|uniref:F-box protein AT5G49610-like beta-propeller domain-containing protein n=1 Tax=Triticum turgidum subsp. durum TaxID=4567 RepID=A0A9R1B6Z0_TRITD|nr:unnamed protein product [Triticum turgidum subsp. durum]